MESLDLFSRYKVTGRQLTGRVSNHNPYPVSQTQNNTGNYMKTAENVLQTSIIIDRPVSYLDCILKHDNESGPIKIFQYMYALARLKESHKKWQNLFKFLT